VTTDNDGQVRFLSRHVSVEMGGRNRGELGIGLVIRELRLFTFCSVMSSKYSWECDERSDLYIEFIYYNRNSFTSAFSLSILLLTSSFLTSGYVRAMFNADFAMYPGSTKRVGGFDRFDPKRASERVDRHP
jgi:hypothetical protein